MYSEIIIVTISVLVLTQLAEAGGGGSHHKKIIIHVPYKVKTIHHTHTIYKHVGKDHGDEKEYKVIGYSGGIDKGQEVSGSEFFGGYGGGFGGAHAEESKDNHESVGYEGYSGGDSEISGANQGYEHGGYEGGEEGYSQGYSQGYSGGYGGGEVGGGDHSSYEAGRSSYDVSPYGSNKYESYEGGQSSDGGHEGY